MLITHERRRSQWKQWLAALATTLPMVTVGTLKILVETNQHILYENQDVHLQLKESAVLFTIIGCVIGAIFGAASADIFGRKKTLYATTISVIGGIIGVFSTSPTSSCIILLIGGINAGIACTVVPLYISEIVNDDIRGRLLMLQLLGIYTGQFAVMSLNPVTEFAAVKGVLIIIPIIFLISFYWFPETPRYLTSKKRYEEAAESMAFFRGIGQLAAKEEIGTVVNALEENGIQQGISLKIQELFQNWKGLVIVTSLIIMQWNRTYFDTREDIAYTLTDITGLRLNHSLLIISATQLIWSLVLVFTIDIVGRRFYLLGSTFIGLLIAIFATAMIMDRSYLLITVSFILHLCQIIIFGIPLVFIGELFPTNIKAMTSAMMVIFDTIFKRVFLGMIWTGTGLAYDDFYVFIPIYLLSFVFILAFVPETKKAIFSVIQCELADNKLMCCRRTTSQHSQIIYTSS